MTVDPLYCFFAAAKAHWQPGEVATRRKTPRGYRILGVSTSPYALLGLNVSRETPVHPACEAYRVGVKERLVPAAGTWLFVPNSKTLIPKFYFRSSLLEKIHPSLLGLATLRLDAAKERKVVRFGRNCRGAGPAGKRMDEELFRPAGMGGQFGRVRLTLQLVGRFKILAGGFFACGASNYLAFCLVGGRAQVFVLYRCLCCALLQRFWRRI
jgi:hypothetical protein